MLRFRLWTAPKGPMSYQSDKRLLKPSVIDSNLLKSPLSEPLRSQTTSLGSDIPSDVHGEMVACPRRSGMIPDLNQGGGFDSGEGRRAF